MTPGAKVLLLAPLNLDIAKVLLVEFGACMKLKIYPNLVQLTFKNFFGPNFIPSELRQAGNFELWVKELKPWAWYQIYIS